MRVGDRIRFNWSSRVWALGTIKEIYGSDRHPLGERLVLWVRDGDDERHTVAVKAGDVRMEPIGGRE